MELNKNQQAIIDLVRDNGPLSRSQINQQLPTPLPKSTLLRYLRSFTKDGVLMVQGSGSDRMYVYGSDAAKPATEKPILTKETTETTIKATVTGDAPPLVKFQLTNPVTYLIRWWKKVMGNEGVDIRFKLRPLTAVVLTIVIISLTAGGYGLAGIFWFINKTPLKNTPLVEYFPQPTESPSPWRETAFTGTLRSNARGYAFLTTEDGEGITLMLPENVNLAPYMNRRILTIGLYNDETHTLQISSADDMELLPYYAEPVPTTQPTPSATPLAPTPVSIPPGGIEVVCTQDAKQCPDGSYVGRIAPNCEFALCPGE